jgi:transposase
VKPFVKRQKNDTADAEAIAEAALRPTMRFVAPKTEAQQAAAMAFRTRDLLVRQRTQTINALRGHLAEYGVVAPAGPAHIGRLIAVIDGESGVLPGPVAKLAGVLVKQIMALSEEIGVLEKEPHGPRCLGADGEGRNLQGSGGRSRIGQRSTG